LLELLLPLLELGELPSRRDRRPVVASYARNLGRARRKPPALARKLIAGLMRRRGPYGLEFARSVIEMKLLRNLRYVRERFGRMERRVVPAYVYAALAPYAAGAREMTDATVRDAVA
jgi:3,8-divinyl protochlorophyllide a 8-vinyl-reductase (ferredoxin)